MDADALLEQHHPADALGPLRAMVCYFDRASLWLARVDGDRLVFANETERWEVPAADLLAMYRCLRTGTRLDWPLLEARYRVGRSAANNRHEQPGVGARVTGS